MAVWVALLVSCAGAARFAIGPDGVLLMEGKKIFPLGFTLGPPSDGKTPDGKDGLQELHDAGGRFIRTGPVGGASWNDRTIEQEQRYEDAAARHGMFCMPWLKELSAIAPGDGKREMVLRKVIARFKNHPALAVWKGADEPDWGKLPVEPLVRAYQLIHQLDGNHPVWIVQAPRGTVESMQRYDAAYDISGADIYPISYPPGIHSLRPNKEISMVGDYTRLMREVCEGKPTWMTLQIAWSGVAKPGWTLRMPTLPQERFMAYEAIINGARGLVFFGGHVRAAWDSQDQRLGWNWNFWRKVLRPVIEELSQGAPLAGALVAPNSKLPVKISGADDIEFCVRESGGDLFILACKREGKTVQVQFEGLPAAAATGEVLFESPRQVQARDGSFTDWFAPFDVHVYKFHLH